MTPDTRGGSADRGPQEGSRRASGKKAENDKLPQAFADLELGDQAGGSRRASEGQETTLIGSTTTSSGRQIIETMLAKGQQKLTYAIEEVVGHGSFGVVYLANCVETRQKVAIKKVLQDRRFKNRELQIMKTLTHMNIVKLEQYYFSSSPKGEVFLNLVLEFVPDTVHNLTKRIREKRQPIALTCVKLYVYQLCSSLAYLHSLNICHRDIKPQNLLVNPETHELKLCDFGSAKQLVKGEPNISYICSRYYRAPELIFGGTDYTPAIDIWSVGCVMAELILGSPIFSGESGVDQLVEIIKVLGTPSREEINSMNPNYTELKFPQIKGHSLNRIFGATIGLDALDLLGKFLIYSPHIRITARAALRHPYFDDLRNPATRLPDGGALPPLEGINVNT